jgi:hypothetical protein
MARLTKDYNLMATNPKLAKEWHPTKNGDLTPFDVTQSSNKKAWWICGKGHEWEAQIYSRTNKTGCPYCVGKAACDDNCLQTLNPELSKEWHPTRNGSITPRDVTSKSGKKAWWVCDKGHEWEASISSRGNGTGCPCCCGKKVCDDNCLKTVNPQLSEEWHPTKNGRLTPKDVTPGSIRKVWWICEKGHEWNATLLNRNRGSGCPFCFRSKKN